MGVYGFYKRKMAGPKTAMKIQFYGKLVTAYLAFLEHSIFQENFAPNYRKFYKTTFHLNYEKEVAEILDIPFEKITQIALIPVAYTIGTKFKSAVRKPLKEVLHLESW